MTYQNYEKEIDYAEQIAKMMERGASAAEVEDMLNRRVNKALDNEELRKYAYDDFYKTARAYIDSKHAEELGVAGSAAGAAAGGSYQSASFTDPYAGQRAALIARTHLLKSQMNKVLTRLEERGYITRDEYENLYEYLYKPYEKLGGNGSAKRIMAEVDKLPIRKDKED